MIKLFNFKFTSDNKEETIIVQHKEFPPVMSDEIGYLSNTITKITLDDTEIKLHNSDIKNENNAVHNTSKNINHDTANATKHTQPQKDTISNTNTI